MNFTTFKPFNPVLFNLLQNNNQVKTQVFFNVFMYLFGLLVQHKVNQMNALAFILSKHVSHHATGLYLCQNC